MSWHKIHHSDGSIVNRDKIILIFHFLILHSLWLLDVIIWEKIKIRAYMGEAKIVMRNNVARSVLRH